MTKLPRSCSIVYTGWAKADAAQMSRYAAPETAARQVAAQLKA